MRVKNTSKFDTETVRKIVKFVRPSGISKFDVMVKNTASGRGGRCYYKGSGYHATADPFITALVSKGATHYPTQTYTAEGKGYLPIPIFSDVESLLIIIAHELRHLWQATHKGWRWYGSRGKFSERDADCYALHMLRKWRREA